MNNTTPISQPSLTPEATTTPVGHTPPVEYQQRLAVERPRAWRGVVALVLLLLGMLVFSALFSLLGMVVDNLLTGATPEGLTPLSFAGALVGLALLTPWSMLLQKWFFGVPMASLHSIVSKFRWGHFGKTVAIAVPVFALLQFVYPWLLPYQTTDYSTLDVVAYLIIGVTLMPLQAMGEEYAFRGLAFRIAASWGRGPRAGLVIGILVSSLLFTLAHLALDPWLNLYYFTFGVALCIITWRTGGLEIAIVLHAVNNVLASVVSVALRQDLDTGFDRSVGAANAVMLIPCALLLIVAALVWWRTPQPASQTLPR